MLNIDEHQAVSKKGEKTPAYQPTPEEEKSLKIVKKLFSKAKKHRSKFDQKWGDYYRMFRGKQWKNERPSYRSSEVINLVFQTIQSFVPIMTDTKPRFEFLPEEPSDIVLSDILNEIIDWDWTRKNWLQVVTEVIYDAHFYGTGLSQLDFDPNGDAGLGTISFESLDPLYCFPAPGAIDVNGKKSRYFITAVPMDVSIVKRLYPQKGKYVKPDTSGLEYLDKNVQSSIKYKSPSDNVVVTTENPDNAASQDNTILYTLFLRDDEYEEVQETRQNPETGLPEPFFVQKLKYPKGRLIQVASNVLLKDIELPIEEGFFPIQKLINYIDPREFWGISEVEQIESPQTLFNKTLSFAMDVMNLMGNPIWVVDTSANIDTDSLINRPGLVVEKNPGAEVRREMGVQLQPFVMNLMESFKQWVDSVSGSQEVSRGINPTGITAASAISQLQQASQTRIRQKSRNLDAYLQDLGQQYLAMVFQYYTVPRIVRITNKQDPQITEYFKFSIEKEEDDNGEEKSVAKVRRYDENNMLGDEEIYKINGKFDVKVVTGSSLPFSKIEKENRLFNLYDRKLIDAEEVLKGLDYPNYEAILQRAQAAQAAMMPPQ